MQSIAKYFFAFFLILFSHVFHSGANEDNKSAQHISIPVNECDLTVSGHLTGYLVNISGFLEDPSVNRNTVRVVSHDTTLRNLTAQKFRFSCAGTYLPTPNYPTRFTTDSCTRPTLILES